MGATRYRENEVKEEITIKTKLPTTTLGATVLVSAGLSPNRCGLPEAVGRYVCSDRHNQVLKVHRVVEY